MRGLRAVARLSLIAALAIAGGAVALPNRAAAHHDATDMHDAGAQTAGRRYQIRGRADRAGQYSAGRAAQAPSPARPRARRRSPSLIAWWC